MLSRDRDLMPRTWMGDEDIRSITRQARLEVFRNDVFQPISITTVVCELIYNAHPMRNIIWISVALQALRLMSVMAAIRLEDKPDKIERALTTALLDGGPLSNKRSIEFASDPLASSTWEEVCCLQYYTWIFMV